MSSTISGRVGSVASARARLVCGPTRGDSQLVAVLAGLFDDEICAVLVDGLGRRVREVAAEARVPVNPLRGREVSDQRALAAARDQDVEAAVVEDSEGVPRRVGDRRVATDRGEPDDVDGVVAQRHGEHHRVVTARVGIEQDFSRHRC